MVKINYEESYKNNFKDNVQGAVRFYLNLHENDTKNGTGFILYPKALNPFLKIMETMKESLNIIILPAFNCDDYKINEPAYLILKISMNTQYINGIEIENI